jgi:hypothetical protein
MLSNTSGQSRSPACGGAVELKAAEISRHQQANSASTVSVYESQASFELTGETVHGFP